MLRFYIALWMAKLSIVALKITKHNGTNFPGVVALKICPNFLKYVSKPEHVIAVTGTNGKTTSVNLLLDALTLDGKKVLSNKFGSNISSGIATSLIYGSTIFNKAKFDAAVMEVDERSAARVFPYLVPEYLLVTNLSRDSIMRNAHPQYIANFLSDNIAKNTKLILNADDLISSSIAKENERVYFGIEKMDTDIIDCINRINDIQICPVCHSPLKYEYRRYNHIGKAYCDACGFKAPKYDYAGSNIDLESMTLTVTDKEGSCEYRILNNSVFNIYNVVSTVAVLRELGYSKERVQELIGKLEIVGSRFEENRFADKTLYMMMAKEKNAFATARVFDYIGHAPGDKEILVMNSCQGDMIHWSENTCWLYDCDFEFLADEKIKNIVVCGPRRYDHKYRLMLAGVPEDRITLVEKELDAPKHLKLIPNDNIYVLYGTDSLAIGMKAGEEVREILRAKAKEA